MNEVNVQDSLHPTEIKGRKNFSPKHLLVAVVSVLIFLSGFFVGKSGLTFYKQDGKVKISREEPADKNIDFTMFWKVWDTLEGDYFDTSKLNSKNMVLGAIQGMVSAVGDPYTVFLPPDENKTVEEDLEGTFEGVGIQIGFKGTRLAVVAPLPGSPAEKAGIKAGDLIVEIKDDAKGVDVGTFGMTLNEAVELIRGESGSKITLTLARDSNEEPILVDVVREKISVPSVTMSIVNESNEVDDNGNIALIKILKFGAETKDEWDKYVREILKDPMISYVIVDLRNNPGGYLQGSVDIASDFLELGDTAVIEESSGGKRDEFKVETIAKLKNYKVVALVNGGSASASEILAGALRDQKSIKLVGETTFGKGTIQEPRQLNGGSSLHITVAKWLTPNGTWVNDGGLKPDFEVEDNPETPEDEQVLKAIEVVRGI